jgi:hypothetical protein
MPNLMCKSTTCDKNLYKLLEPQMKNCKLWQEQQRMLLKTMVYYGFANRQKPIRVRIAAERVLLACLPPKGMSQLDKLLSTTIGQLYAFVKSRILNP